METRNINVETYCNTSLRNAKAFTFVELIVSVWIILLISTIGYMSYSGSLETKDNAKVTSDLATIDNSFKSYFAENKSLPEASGNQSFYKDDGTYAHDASDSAYGVSSFVSEKTLPAKYLNSIPLDPRTKYYYAYGKTIDNKFYEIAWVEKKDNNYKSVVAGNYKTIWDELSNLVREYNWPEFVSNNSTEHFPYNPEEKILTAQINDYSGSVSVIHNWTTISDWTWILDTALVTGDTIKAWTGSSVNIYFSDWSKSYLWDSSRASELNLTNMSYKQDSNLFTKIKLVLNVWTLWTAASKMNTNSDFDVYSNDTVAAVRWTIFWVTVTQRTSSLKASTNIVVKQWDVQVNKLIGTNTLCTQAREPIKSDSLESAIKNEDSSDTAAWTVTNIYWSCPINLPWTIDSDHIKVSSGENPKWMKSDNASATWVVSTGAIISIPWNTTSQTNITNWDFSFNAADYKIKLISSTNTPPFSPQYRNFQAKIRVDKKLLNHFTYFKLNDIDNIRFSDINLINTWTYIFTWGLRKFNCYIFGWDITCGSNNLQQILLNNSWKFELKACKKNPKWEEICSKSLNLKVPNGLMNYSPKCLNPKPTFGDEQVDDSLCDKWYELVGYAGYNEEKELYTNGANITKNYWYIDNRVDPNTWIRSNLWNISPLETLNWWLFFESWKSSWTPIPGIEYIGTSSNMLFVQNNYTFPTWSWFLAWATYLGNSFLSNVWTQKVSWIFLDNNNDSSQNDFLKYDISPLSLSWSDFAIEMSVRGAALKRPSWWYVLFDIPWVSPWNWFRLSTYNTEWLYLWQHSFGGNNQIISLLQINSKITNSDSNKFYKVIASYINNQAKIEIYDWENKILESSQYTGWVTSINPWTLNNLYIWNYNYSGTYQYQWNDIIDYVKIYRK